MPGTRTGPPSWSAACSGVPDEARWHERHRDPATACAASAAAVPGDKEGSGTSGERTLRVNPITCTGHGMCAELLPELIRLDPWGYPILSSTRCPAPLAGSRQAGGAACPTLALLMDGGGRPAPVSGRSVVARSRALAP